MDHPFTCEEGLKIYLLDNRRKKDYLWDFHMPAQAFHAPGAVPFPQMPLH